MNPNQDSEVLLMKSCLLIAIFLDGVYSLFMWLGLSQARITQVLLPPILRFQKLFEHPENLHADTVERVCGQIDQVGPFVLLGLTFCWGNDSGIVMR